MRRVNDERGAIAVIVALMMVVLLACGAIVIDAGALYQERRELQNGADAAALAIASDCAHGDCGSVDDTAARYADDNALDGVSAVDGVDVDGDAQEVTVATSTERPDGMLQISYALAGALSDDLDGKTVHAQATAKWGSPATVPALPLAIARCELDSQIDDHGFVDLDDVDDVTPTVLMFHDGNPISRGADCGDPDSANQDAPGGFGWLDLDTNVDDCRPRIDTDQQIDGDNGSGPPPNRMGCDDVFPDLVGTVVYVPIYDWVAGQHADGTPCGGGNGNGGGNNALTSASFEPDGNGNGGGSSKTTTTTTTPTTTTTTPATTTTTVKSNGG